MLLLVVALLPAAIRADGPAPRTTRFDPDGRGGVVVPVYLNGHGPFRFLLDTGSTHSSISEEVAGIASAPPVARVAVGSVAGEQMHIVVRVDRLECGPLVLTNVLPTVVDLSAIDPSGRIHGVIGQDVLSPVRYTIDFRRHEVLWWPDAHPENPAASIFALEASDGRFLVSLPQRASVLRLVPDSGAETLLLFDGHDVELPAMSRQGVTSELASLTARRTVREARVLELRVGRQRFRDVRTVVVGRQPMEPMDTDGLLPLHLFGRVTFDGPRGLLILEG